MEKWLNLIPSYFGPLMFFVVILIALLLGYLNGWKTVLYFLVINIVGLVSILTTLILTRDTIIERIASWLGDGFGQLLLNGKDQLKTIFAIVFIVLGLIILNFISMIIYLIFFRRRLKKTIKKNRKAGIKSILPRTIGAGLAIVVALPIAASVSAVKPSNNPKGFTKFNNTLFKGITGGYVEEASVDIYKVNELVNAATDLVDAKEELKDIFTGETPDITKFTPETAKSLETVLNSGLIDEKVLKSFVGDLNLDFSSPPEPIQGITKISIKPELEEDIFNAISSAFGDETTNNEDIKNYLQGIGLI